MKQQKFDGGAIAVYATLAIGAIAITTYLILGTGESKLDQCVKKAENVYSEILYSKCQKDSGKLYNCPDGINPRDFLEEELKTCASLYK